MKLSDNQMETVRTRPQKAGLDLFIFEPQPVLHAQINGSVAKGDRIIPYVYITGSYSDIESGMTMLVGTSPGLEDVGRIRVKSADDSNIIVSENDNLRWVNGQYLTVLKYWEVWPIHPRMIQNPNNVEDIIFYKDYDDPHIQQNNNYGSFINMGCHAPVLLENGTADVYYSASGTSNLRGQGLSYLWTFEGGTPSSSTSHTPGMVSYDTEGDFVTRLRVTSTAGAVDYSYRYVSVRSRVGQGEKTPIKNWEMGEVSGGRNEAGYTVEFVLHEMVELFEGAVVMLRMENHYGTQKISLGGNSIGRENVFFCGYIDKGSIEYNYKTSQVRFTASTIHNRMKQATSFSVSVESVKNASVWYEAKDMDVRRAIYHYLRYHSTVLQVADFSFKGTDYPIQFFDADRGSLFDAVDSLMQSALVGTLCSDRQGNLFAEVSPKAYSDPTGTFASQKVMSIINRDWMGTPKIEERLYDNLSYMEAGGIAYSGANTGTFKALLAEAPGVPSFHGSVEKISGLALDSQSQLNTLVGHLWANQNSKYPSIQIDGTNTFTNLDVAPYEVVQIDVSAEDTVRGEEISGLYIPSQISWKYDSKRGTLLPSITFESLVNGAPGRTITIPPPEEIEFPPLPPLPPLPPFPPPPPIIPPINPENVDNVQILVKNHGIYYTNDFSNTTPTWYPMDVGIVGSGIRAFETTATGKMIAHQGSGLFYATSPGDSWKQVFDSTIDIKNVQGYPFPRDPLLVGFGAVRNSDGDIILVGGLVVTISSAFIIYTWSGNVADFPTTQSSTYLEQIDRDYGSLIYNGTNWIFSHIAGGVNPRTYSMVANNDGITYSNWQSLSSIGAYPNIVIQSRFDTISAVIKLGTTYPNVPELTTDGGVTYTPITGSAPFMSGLGTVDVFESIMAINEGQWIVAGGAYPRSFHFSLDGGASWDSQILATGTITSVWHLGDEDFILCGNNSIYGMRGFLATGTPTVTGSFIVDKTGNLRNWLTGSFQVFSVRHY